MGISPIAVLDVCVPSSVFLYSNIKKVENGDTARGSVVFAQGAKIAEAVAKYHDSTAKNASEAYNIFGKYADKSKVLNTTGKVVNWATHNVNPLICLSAAYKTATADDKVHTGITQVGALSGMFLGEGMMKIYQDNIFNEKNVTKLAEKAKGITGLKSLANFILKSGNGGKVASILKGIAFVCTSMTSYNLGEKLAGNLADRICTDAGIEESEKPAEEENTEGKVENNDNTTKKIDQMV